MKTRVLLVCILLISLLTSTISAFAAREYDYTVQPGDTLFSIARRYGITVETLATANNLPATTWLYVGQSLVIPGGREYGFHASE
jgi:LysM repeat protein